MVRKWRRCAVPDPCMRVPWGEGSRGVGVGARGSCQGPLRQARTSVRDAMGDRRRPAPRPLRNEDERLGGPSTGSGRTDLGGARAVGSGGCDGGRRCPAPRPALGSRESGNDDGGCGGMRWREGFGSGWGPALAGGRFANRPYDRGGAHEGGGDAGAAGGRPSLRQAQGERVWEGRGRWGVGDAMGGRRCPAPRPALGSRESGNDDGGCGGMRWREGFGSGWAARGPLSRAGGSRTAPTTGVGRTRARVMRGLLVEGPSTGSGRTDLGGARAVGSGGCDGGAFAK